MKTDYLEVSLEDFSGYVAVDEVYDGPFCVLVLVDSRRQRRLVYAVLDTSPPTRTCNLSWPILKACWTPGT